MGEGAPGIGMWSGIDHGIEDLACERSANIMALSFWSAAGGVVLLSRLRILIFFSSSCRLFLHFFSVTPRFLFICLFIFLNFILVFSLILFF